MFFAWSTLPTAPRGYVVDLLSQRGRAANRHQGEAGEPLRLHGQAGVPPPQLLALWRSQVRSPSKRHGLGSPQERVLHVFAAQSVRLASAQEGPLNRRASPGSLCRTFTEGLVSDRLRAELRTPIHLPKCGVSCLAFPSSIIYRL